MRLKYGIAIAGSHGKTTTTSMVATVLAAAGLDPTAVVGGKVNVLRLQRQAGQGRADGGGGRRVGRLASCKLHPTIAVVTNIDPEHLDHYGTLDALQAGASSSSCNRVPFYGLAVLCLDHPNVQALLPAGREARRHLRRARTQADYRAEGIEARRASPTRFDAFRRGEPLGRVRACAWWARHNALNALAVIAVADEMEHPARRRPRGARRLPAACSAASPCAARPAGVTVVDDYGHHPAEVRATLRGAREAFGRRLVVASSSRTATPAPATCSPSSPPPSTTPTCSSLTDIYAAGEEPIPGVTGEVLAEAIRATATAT